VIQIINVKGKLQKTGNKIPQVRLWQILRAALINLRLISAALVFLSFSCGNRAFSMRRKTHIKVKPFQNFSFRNIFSRFTEKPGL
jgi:hypothetical protein